jgi:hypothetical protein
MKEVDLKLSGNNVFLKSLFPDAVIKTDSLLLGDLNVDYLTSAIKSSNNLQLDYSGFKILDIDLEGNYGDWTVTTKLNVW